MRSYFSSSNNNVIIINTIIIIFFYYYYYYYLLEAPQTQSFISNMKSIKLNSLIPRLSRIWTLLSLSASFSLLIKHDMAGQQGELEWP